MRNFFTIILIFCYVICFGDGHKKTIIIDTVTGQIRQFRVELHPKNQNSTELYKVDSQAFLGDSILRDVIIQVHFEDSCNLKMALDDKGGFLWLQNLGNTTGDTIKISRFHIYENCLPDTMTHSVSRYRKVVSDTGYVKLIIKSSKELITIAKTNCSQRLPDFLKLTINKEVHTISVGAFIQTEISVGHGYYGLFRKLNQKRKEHNKSYNYFVVGNARRAAVMNCIVAL